MNTVSAIIGDPINKYLAQCRVKNDLVESEDTHVPPTAAEAQSLIAYLKQQGVEAVVVGSVGVLHYVKDPSKFRPTVDLDLFVHATEEKFKKIKPPSGWSIDRESIGVASWISPTGGYVDFLTAGHQFPGGGRGATKVGVDPSSKSYPVATAVDIFKMKLNSTREKDLTDLIGLSRAIGRVPTEKEVGPLNQTQRDNLDMVQQWFKLRPQGSYGA